MRNPPPLAVMLAVFLPSPALAYISPGAEVGAIAFTVALVVGLLLLVVGLVWHPLKRLLKSKRGGSTTSDRPDGLE